MKLLLAVLLVGIVTLIGHRARAQASGDAEQAKGAAEIQKLGGEVKTEQASGAIVEVDLCNNRVGDRDLAVLEGLSQLRKLSLYGASVTDEGLKHLAGLTHLRSLDLSETGVTDAGLANLRGLTELRTLILMRNRVAGPGLQHLSQLKRASGPDVLRRARDCRRPAKPRWADATHGPNHHRNQATERGLGSLKGLTRLESLSLGNCSDLSAAGLEHLADLGGLRSLFLGHSDVGDADLVNLSGMTHLRYLDLSGTELSDAGLEHLKALTRLRNLISALPR